MKGARMNGDGLSLGSEDSIDPDEFEDSIIDERIQLLMDKLQPIPAEILQAYHGEQP